jgi:hypothetical protein
MLPQPITACNLSLKIMKHTNYAKLSSTQTIQPNLVQYSQLLKLTASNYNTKMVLLNTISLKILILVIRPLMLRNSQPTDLLSKYGRPLIMLVWPPNLVSMWDFTAPRLPKATQIKTSKTLEKNVWTEP